MQSPITDRQMARYWTHRAAELDSMRPLTASEAAARAEEYGARATRLRGDAAAIRASGEASCPRGRQPARYRRTALRDHARDLRETRSVASVIEHEARLWELRAEAQCRIADAEHGTPLATARAEAHARAEYYTLRLASHAGPEPAWGRRRTR